MKKTLLGLSVVTLLLSSCTKETAKVVPPASTPKLEGSKSYVRMTFLGKTLETRDTIMNEPGAAPHFKPFVNTFNYYLSFDNLFDKTFAINTFSGDKFTNGNMKLVISATSFARKTNSLKDTFRTVTTSPNAYFLEDLTTKGIYTINPGSTIIITDTTAEYTKGTITMKMKSGSTATIDATGEFKIYKSTGY